MMGAEREILPRLVALDVFDQYVVPHEQLQRGATRMQPAIDALAAGSPSPANEIYVRRTGLTDAGRLRRARCIGAPAKLTPVPPGSG
jgi:hypothetical protein